MRPRKKKENKFGDSHKNGIKLSVFFIILTSSCNEAKPNYFASIFMLVIALTP